MYSCRLKMVRRQRVTSTTNYILLNTRSLQLDVFHTSSIGYGRPQMMRVWTKFRATYPKLQLPNT